MKNKKDERRYNMEKKTIFGIFALVMVAVLGVSMVVAHGLGGFGFAQILTDEQKAEIQTQHQEIQDAISNGDFDLWKSLQEERIAKMQEQLTEENFNEIVERSNQTDEFRNAMQEARESGDFTEVKALQDEYGMTGFGRGHFGKMRMGFKPFTN